MESTSMGGRVERWVDLQFAGQPMVSKKELVGKARKSDLPEEAVAAIEMLPSGTWPTDEIVHDIVDVLETRAGGGARGRGNKGGGKH